MIDAIDVTFLLLDAGVVNPLEFVPTLSHHMWSESTRPGQSDLVPVASAETLVRNYERAFGRRNPFTIVARSILADAVGQTGETAEAVRLYQQLLVDQESELRADHPAVLANRYRAAIWTAKDGHPSPALVALQNLLGDQERSSDPEHPNTLAIQASIGQLLAVTGDRDAAIAMLHEVNAKQLRILGSEHPSTEATRRALAELQDE